MSSDKHRTDEDAAWSFADRSVYGVLSMIDADGEPYGVPLNLFRDGTAFYFHSSPDGRKARALRAHPRVSISFVPYAEVVPEKLTTHYASAVFSGTAEEVTGPDEKCRLIRLLCCRFGAKEHPAMQSENGFASCMPATAIWRIRTDAVSGKEYR